MAKNFRGFVEKCDSTVGLCGWFLDRDEPDLSVQVDIFVDGNLLCQAPADVFRQDLLDKGLGNGKHGFRIAVPNKFFDDKEHIFSLGADGIVVPSSAKTFLLPPKTFVPIILGNVDNCDDKGIRGWIVYENDLQQVVSIDVVIDDELIVTTEANLFRKDLTNFRDGNCAFNVPIPDKFWDGVEHKVYVKVLNKIYFQRMFAFENFDYQFYIEYYEDLKNLSYDQAFAHYISQGIKEKRFVSAKSFFGTKNINLLELPKNFIAQTYIDLNPDLCNLNKYQAIEHYLLFGKKESRNFQLDVKFFNIPVSIHGMVFNATSDTIRSHSHHKLNNVLHIFDAYWHGIRSATACLPGHKLAISHKLAPSNDAFTYLISYIKVNKIKVICYQGFSLNALHIANFLRNEFDSLIQQYIITHVSSAQFENIFEMTMIGKMLEGLENGLFFRLGAVKPRFSGTIPEFWPKTIINSIPNISRFTIFRDLSRVLIPVENNWRKNLYTNVLSAIHCKHVKKINLVNWPNGIEYIASSEKLEWLPFMKPIKMLSHAASCAAIIHSSLIECQPMTQLEGLAVGTPTITAKLGVHPIIDNDHLTQLCEVDFPDDVGALTKTLSIICQLWHDDIRSLQQMIEDHIKIRNKLSIESYLDFLGLS